VAELEKENHELGKRIDFAYESVKADKAEVDRLCGCVQRRDATIADLRAKLEEAERWAKSLADQQAKSLEERRLAAAGGGVDPELLETARRMMVAIVAKRPLETVEDTGIDEVDREIARGAIGYARAFHAALRQAGGGE